MNPLDASSIITAAGLIGIFVVLVAETGLLVGFFLPGDSLLFTAGLLAASQGPAQLPLGPLLAVAAAGALIGAQIGYVIGKRLGTRLLVRATRPVPIVQTVMNPMAGVLAVPAKTFTIAQVLGGLLWTTGIILAGSWLGHWIPGIDTYLLPIIAVSLIPVALEFRRMRPAARAEPPGPPVDFAPPATGVGR